MLGEWPEWLTLDLFVGVTVVLAALAAVWKVFRPATKRAQEVWEWFEGFRLDWDGAGPRPGRSAQVGIMERLNRIDGEFQRNHGSSLKDRVEHAIESVKDLATLQTSQATILTEVGNLKSKVTTISDRIERLERNVNAAVSTTTTVHEETTVSETNGSSEATTRIV